MTLSCQNPGTCQVILIEDDPLLLVVLAMQLQNAGINFCSASNGYDALTLVKSHRPKILLLDVSIPGLTGFEVVDAIRRDPDLEDLQNMHLIIHTSHDLSSEEQRTLTFGQTLFLTKTRLSEDLSEIVKKVLARS